MLGAKFYVPFYPVITCFRVLKADHHPLAIGNLPKYQGRDYPPPIHVFNFVSNMLYYRMSVDGSRQGIADSGIELQTLRNAFIG